MDDDHKQPSLADRQNLCHKCQELDVDRWAEDMVSAMMQGVEYFNQLYKEPSISFGTYLDVAGRQDCPFCRLVLHLLPPSAPSQSKISEDGEPNVLYEPSTSLKRFPEAHTVRFGGHYRGQISRVSRGGGAYDFPVVFAPEMGNSSNCFPPKRLEPSQIRKWIKECELNHDNTASGILSTKPTAPIDLVLIDVLENCLIQASSGYRFFALSYVWGGVSMLQTIIQNRALLSLRGALSESWSKLPRVIQDAIKLVRLLGERYLWVDSLCIEQDNIAQKERDIMQMDVVYSHAFATIVSISGSDARAVLPGVLEDSRRPMAAIEMISDHKLVALRPILHSVIENSVHESRAWTFQETLLSKRLLLFTDQVLYYHCHSTLRSDCPETFRLDMMDMSHFFDPLRVFANENPHATAIDAAPADQQLDKFPNEFPRIGGSRAYHIYIRLVERYSCRKLSNPLDALNAFAGIKAVLNSEFGFNFICGIPEEHLDLCLLWAPSASTGLPQTRNPAFPSWSWAGWIGGSLWAPMHSFFEEIHSVFGSPTLKSEIEELQTTNENLAKLGPGRFYTCALNAQRRTRDAGKASVLHLKRRQGMLYFQAFIVTRSSFPPLDGRLSPFHRELKIPSFTRLKDGNSQRRGVLFESDSSPHMCEADHRHSEFVLLSRYYRESEKMFKCTMFSNIYNLICDRRIFPFSPWCLLNIMLIEWKGDRAERLAIGLIHEDAWSNAVPTKKHIILG